MITIWRWYFKGWVKWLIGPNFVLAALAGIGMQLKLHLPFFVGALIGLFCLFIALPFLQYHGRDDSER